jgi:hypothetical protein
MGCFIVEKAPIQPIAYVAEYDDEYQDYAEAHMSFRIA